ncbi:MAG TPA: 50S ribosomal protein L31e [Candidatus Bathyarchaeia archaeon]|nr:50S ribosomal protein L31e [Candidatus Bathyarchaeia archaeon]
MPKDTKVEEERVYVIPLRAVKRTPRWRRSKRAMSEIRQYLAHHLNAEADKVKLDPSINEKIWQRGSSNPPNKIAVRAMKFDDGVVEAELAAES